jgi:hypothetical protein
LNASFLKYLFVPALAALCMAAALAAPRKVETFEAGTWQRLQTTLQQPTAVVFTTTDCAHCPAVIARLRQDIERRRFKAALSAVVMDQAPGDDDARLLRSRHYQPADRLFAFAGQAAVLRFGVDPSWRGVTPYIVFLVPQAESRTVTGPPAAADFDAWVRAAARSGQRH